MRGLILLLVVAFTLPCLGQPNPETQWSHVYGMDYVDIASDLIQSASGNFLAVGYIQPGDLWSDNCPTLMKISPAGAWLGAYTFPNFGEGSFGAVIELPDRGCALLGHIWQPGHSDLDILLLGADSNGTYQWSRILGTVNASDQAISFVRTAEGGYLITGATGPSFLDVDVMVWLTDSVGQIISQHMYGGDSTDYGAQIRRSADGNYVIAGSTGSFGAGGHDAYLLKVNSDGDTLWGRTFGGTGDDSFSDVICLADGSMFCVGGTESFGEGHVYLVQVDSAGNELWSQHVGGEPGEIGSSVVPAAQGGYAISGQISMGEMTSDGYLLRVTDDGELLWRCRYDRTEIDWFSSILQTPDGCFVMAGSTIETHGTATSNDWWVVKTGPDPILDVLVAGAAMPTEFALSAYPNPFNASTTLALDLPLTGPVTVTLVDALGRQAQTFDFPTLTAGRHELRVDGTPLASGVYFVRVTAGSFSATRKLVLLK